MSYEISNFQQDVIEASYKQPVLVDFWAEWCGPCRMLGPVLEKLAQKYTGKWLLAKVNTDVHQEPAMQYNISSIPAVKLFINGEVVDEFVGALPEPQIETWLKKALPNKNDEIVQQAANLLSVNESEKAQQLLEEVLKAEPEHERAGILLAQTQVYNNPDKAIEMVAHIEPGSTYDDVAEGIRNLGELIKLSGATGSLPEGEGKVKYEEAVKALKNQNFDEALEAFIEVIRNDRYYHDDGARKACLAIFKYLGEEHETTLKHRKVFNRALY